MIPGILWLVNDLPPESQPYAIRFWEAQFRFAFYNCTLHDTMGGMKVPTKYT